MVGSTNGWPEREIEEGAVVVGFREEIGNATVSSGEEERKGGEEMKGRKRRKGLPFYRGRGELLEAR